MRHARDRSLKVTSAAVPIRVVFRAVQRVEEVLLTSAILMIAAFTCVNVVTRTAFGFSLAWAEELSQFLMVVVTFVGLSYAASRGRHIRMTALYDQLPRRWRKAVMIATSAITSAMLAALVVFAIQYIATLRVLGTVSPALRVPLHLVYWVAPLGLGLASVQYALGVVRNCLDEEVYVSFDVRDEYEETTQAGI